MNIHPSLQPAADQLAAYEAKIASLRVRDRMFVRKQEMLPECKPYRLLGANVLWANWPADNDELPDKEHVQQLIQADTSQPYVINIEHWHWDIRHHPIAEVDATIEKIVTILEWCREANPDGDYGIYALCMLRDYHSPVKERDLDEWYAANDYLKPIRDASDSLYPSIYTFYEDREGWEKYAKANIAECVRVSEGKPVRPFWWPRYHTSNKTVGGQLIESEYLKLQLDIMADQPIDAIYAWDLWSQSSAWESELRETCRQWARGE